MKRRTLLIALTASCILTSMVTADTKKKALDARARTVKKAPAKVNPTTAAKVEVKSVSPESIGIMPGDKPVTVTLTGTNLNLITSAALVSGNWPVKGSTITLGEANLTKRNVSFYAEAKTKSNSNCQLRLTAGKQIINVSAEMLRIGIINSNAATSQADRSSAGTPSSNSGNAISGVNSTASGSYNTISGGKDNSVSGDYATVIGGCSNTATGNFSTVGGGFGNKATGAFSFAAGRQARAEHISTFVWSDDTISNFTSTDNYQFLIRTRNGVGINTNKPDATLDVNGDLKVSGAYKGNISSSSGSDGAPFPRPAYDSGWIHLNNGRDDNNRILTHNIGGNPDNYFVDLQQKDEDRIHNKFIGAPYYGRESTTSDPSASSRRTGACYYDLTSTQITVERGYGDVNVEKVRVRIWVYH